MIANVVKYILVDMNSFYTNKLNNTINNLFKYIMEVG